MLKRVFCVILYFSKVVNVCLFIAIILRRLSVFLDFRTVILDWLIDWLFFVAPGAPAVSWAIGARLWYSKMASALPSIGPKLFFVTSTLLRHEGVVSGYLGIPWRDFGLHSWSPSFVIFFRSFYLVGCFARCVQQLSLSFWRRLSTNIEVLASRSTREECWAERCRKEWKQKDHRWGRPRRSLPEGNSPKSFKKNSSLSSNEGLKLSLSVCLHPIVL